MNRIAIAGIAAAFSLALTSPGWSQPRLPHTPSDQEITMLPEECKIILKGTDSQKKWFYQQFPGLVGPNHYCIGLNFVNRARFNSRGKAEKQFNLQSAINEFDYVLKHSEPNAKGLEMIRSQQDQARIMLKMR